VQLFLVRFFNQGRIHIFIVYNAINFLIWDGNGKEWEFPHGNGMGMGISKKWEGGGEGRGTDSMGMTGSGNVQSNFLVISKLDAVTRSHRFSTTSSGFQYGSESVTSSLCVRGSVAALLLHAYRNSPSQWKMFEVVHGYTVCMRQLHAFSCE